MQSNMTHQFSQVPRADIQRSSFDRTSSYKTTFDVNKLIPFLVDEALPGDTFNVNVKAFVRLNTPISPIMDNMKIDTQFFAIPIRLVWDNFKKMMGEQTNPGDSIDYLTPVSYAPASTGFLNQTLMDYMGIPTYVPDLEFSALFHRAYQLTVNEWYRDQNLQDSIVVDTGDGPDTTTPVTIFTRGKRHDYFTSCLPWPQKGDEVTLPLGSTAPVINSGSPFVLATSAVGNTNLGNVQTDATSNLFKAGTAPGSLANTYASDGSYDSGLMADLTNATAATLNALREAFQTQRLIERDARGGTRYTEIILSHFGVSSPDQRLQRPEFLGGGSSDINITPIAQTSSTDVTTPQGNLAAMGTANFGSGHGFTKSFTEHCIILGLCSVRADLTYQQGLNRMFSRRTRYDYYMPVLAHLGEQAVTNVELYAQDPTTDTGATGTPDNERVFGYQERWSEYRYKPSQITGKLRSNDPASLDTWHLSQDFASLPILNDSFIQEATPIDRVVAVPTEPDFLGDFFIQMHCARPMPLYSVPGMTDHF